MTSARYVSLELSNLDIEEYLGLAYSSKDIQADHDTSKDLCDGTNPLENSA
jgi:hypothetical protein